jgi:hypothetical protein
MTRTISRRTAFAGSCAAAAMPLRRARAAQTIRIGVLTDLNGPNSNGTGEGSVAATKLAAEDFMHAHPDITVEVLYADYQSKPDIAQSIARDWFDRQGVDFISTVNNSSAAFAVATLVRVADPTHLAGRYQNSAGASSVPASTTPRLSSLPRPPADGQDPSRATDPRTRSADLRDTPPGRRPHNRGSHARSSSRYVPRPCCAR